MSDHEDDNSHAGYHDTDHQSAYVYIPSNAVANEPTRPSKRRKIGKQKSSDEQPGDPTTLEFDALLNGKETSEWIQRRHELYVRAWSHTESQIQSILDEANEDTLQDVTKFVQESSQERFDQTETIPSGFIITGPNIASQGLLFDQLSARLRAEIHGPAVILRSGDAPNLKAVLKRVIRDATNQKNNLEDDDEISSGLGGRKLLNYDLEVLHTFVRAQGSQAVIVAFQDSEAFDTSLITDLIALFSSWSDRIPFVLLFGIATSLDLFQERLPRIASKSLRGTQFDVEQTSSLVERMFKKILAGGNAPLRLSPSLVASLVERQQEHAQSVQSFTAALKYSYMCHFFADALSILTPVLGASPSLDHLQPEHYEAVRMLPSFKSHIKSLVETQDLDRVVDLLEDDTILLDELEACLSNKPVLHLLRTMSVISISLPDPVSSIDLYMATFDGTLRDSDFVDRILESTKRMAPDELVSFLQRICGVVQDGSSEMDLDGWADEDEEFLAEIISFQSQASDLANEASKTGKPIRSSYAIRSQGLRTTVIAQRVQLSYEDSTLSQQDKQYTTLVDKLNDRLKNYFDIGSPQEIFLHEVWLYDSMLPYREVFTPKPRATIERALSAPYDYLKCECCESVEGLSSTHPATAILYQMYLETCSLINVFDLWSAFFEMVSGGDEQKMEERDALVLFYSALADLKSLGMIKPSKKKADHLAKTTWKGL
ncbi:uncharacterized protein LY89DRAFT_572219 [Mollisia scopiformis]|uniref:Origin recognition complex subunit 3 n=1 Tax=Mollisia scopiformis TaxID=149040 RepID=A0A194XV13_MOLSC|nr:uncharacterized protein LY89DRAFT_572219 [Mollisia scopiformis]KUJ24048.1 hypothetical protein LY89DRAFT_572219 [Mollisia scopiformis]